MAESSATAHASVTELDQLRAEMGVSRRGFFGPHLDEQTVRQAICEQEQECFGWESYPEAT